MLYKYSKNTVDEIENQGRLFFFIVVSGYK